MVDERKDEGDQGENRVEAVESYIRRASGIIVAWSSETGGSASATGSSTWLLRPAGVQTIAT